jgi:ribosomal protein L16 Arg81 hydroxylase
LSFSRWPYPRLRLAKEGKDVPSSYYSTPGPSGEDYTHLQFRELYRLLESGASLVLDAVDELWPPVRELAESLEKLLREYVKVNVYASWTTNPAFDRHWDDHDVIIIQIYGSKRWDLYGETRQFPTRRDTDPNLEPPDTKPRVFTVEAGDVFHVPRGHWHSVCTLDAPSLHLTIGVTQRTGLDYLHWVVDQLTEEQALRMPLPHYSRTALDEHQRLIARLATDALSKENSIGRFLEHRDALAPIRQRASFPLLNGHETTQLDHGEILRWLPSRATLVAEQDNLVVRSNGLKWVFRPSAGPVLQLLHNEREVRLRRLLEAAELSERSTARLIAELEREGLVARHSPNASHSSQTRSPR